MGAWGRVCNWGEISFSFREESELGSHGYLTKGYTKKGKGNWGSQEKKNRSILRAEQCYWTGAVRDRPHWMDFIFGLDHLACVPEPMSSSQNVFKRNLRKFVFWFVLLRGVKQLEWIWGLSPIFIIWVAYANASVISVDSLLCTLKLSTLWFLVEKNHNVFLMVCRKSQTIFEIQFTHFTATFQHWLAWYT